MSSKPIINQFTGVNFDIIVNKDDSFDPIQLVFWEDAEKTIPLDITGNTYDAPIFKNWIEKGQLGLEIIAPNKLEITYGINALPRNDYYFHIRKTNLPVEVQAYGDLKYLQK